MDHAYVYSNYIRIERDDLLAAMVNEAKLESLDETLEMLHAPTNEELADFVHKNYSELYASEWRNEFEKIHKIVARFIDGANYDVLNEYKLEVPCLKPPVYYDVIEEGTPAGLQQVMLWILNVGNPIYVTHALAKWKLYGLPSFLEPNFEQLVPWEKPWFRYGIYDEFFTNSVERLKIEASYHRYEASTIKLEKLYSHKYGFYLNDEDESEGFFDIRRLVFGL